MSVPPLILVDAGNTRLKFGLAHPRAEQQQRLPDCTDFVAVRSEEAIPWSTICGWARGEASHPQGVVTGSNPAQIARVCSEWPADWPVPRTMTDYSELPIEIAVDFPERVGMDRLLDGVAANVLRRPSQPIIVIDVGTATTVNAVSKAGVFLGGAILAGPELTARALNDYTAALPHVTLDEFTATEPPVIGRNTEDAIRSGLYWGHWQSVWSYCVRMMEPLEVAQAPQIVLTGGAAELFVNRLSPSHTYAPHLTLQGLAVAAMHTPTARGR